MSFTRSDQFHLKAAQGWLELGNHLEANEELENISPELRAHPDVLKLRLEIYTHAKHWAACIEVAATLFRFVKGREANWQLPYKLACYCVQLNRMDAAKVWFQKAMAIDTKTVQVKAMEDDDLKPLWDSMSGTMWLRE